MICTTESSSDFYDLLRIPRDTSTSDIKVAYHRTLLLRHPDKQSRLRIDGPGDRLQPEAVDIAQLKEAYATLSDPSLRAAYDAALRREVNAKSHGPRPAQVVSLEEFTTSGEGDDAFESPQEWRYRCRCGGEYRISEEDLESGRHLVGCESCSEVIWVGYEIAEENE